MLNTSRREPGTVALQPEQKGYCGRGRGESQGKICNKNDLEGERLASRFKKNGKKWKRMESSSISGSLGVDKSVRLTKGV